MIRNELATRPTEAETPIEAALFALLDHVSGLLAEEYVALVREDSQCRAEPNRKNER